MRVFFALLSVTVAAAGCGAVPLVPGASADGWTGLPPADAAAGPDLTSPPGEPGLGATPHPDGTTFRVWAPNAERVFVAGDFNAWSQAAHELQREPQGGVFGGDVAGATVGQTYRYLIHKNGQVLERHDPRARQVTSFTGASVISDPRAFAWTQTTWQPPPFNEQVIYELHLGTFAVAPGATWGTFAEARTKLDHLAALGVNMIELLPPAEYRGARSWGYNPQFPFAIESVYGTPDDLRRLVDAAHARGIGVIADVVYNHFTDREQPLQCYDGDCQGKNGIYFYRDADRALTPWGPRPDFGSAEVRTFLRDNALMWLDEYRMDGLRWDSTVNVRAFNDGATAIPDGWALLVSGNDTIDARFPRTLQIAEDLKADDKLTRSTAQGGAGFDTQWDPAFFHPVNGAMIAATDAARSMTAIRDALQHRHNGDAMQRVVFTESHDEVANGKKRIPEMVSPGSAGSLAARKRSTLGAALVLTAPGIPMLFMGMEFLEAGSFADQKPLDWSKTTTYAGILRLYHDLVALRRNLGGVSRGLTGGGLKVSHVNDTDKVIAYHRWLQGGVGDDVVVLANFADRAYAAYEIGLPRAGAWKVLLNSDALTYSSDYGNTQTQGAVTTPVARDGYPQKAPFALGRWSFVVLGWDGIK